MTEDYYSTDNMKTIREAVKASPDGYVINEHEENSDEMVNFFFMGQYEGREVV
jgi:hypothetical protein